MQIIAFAFKKGSGKSTAGKFLSTYLKINANHLKVKQISFAAKLKDVCHQLYKWAGLQSAIYYESHRNKKEVVLPKVGLSPRDIWIQVGNKMREVYENTWIDFALQGVSADILIISDLRFPNEASAIIEHGGLLVKISRDGLPQGTDPAEVDLDDWENWDYVIANNFSLQMLNTAVEVIAKDLIKKCLR